MWLRFRFKSNKKLPELGVFIEKNITKVSATVLLVGTVLAFVMPYVMSQFTVFGVSEPNAIGDTFNGIASPFIGLVGIFLTFLAFYIQYMANERQVIELEKQKKNTEYRDLQDRVRQIKNDIRDLTYTDEGKTYIYTEAIWHFLSSTYQNNSEESKVVSPIFFQLSYVVSLFEPLMNEIDRCELTHKEKKTLFGNLKSLFDSSLDLILIVSEEYAKKNNSQPQKSNLRSRVVIPAKSLKIKIAERFEKYSESEKELFLQIIPTIKGSQFIKQAKVIQGKAGIIFYPNYEAYLTGSQNGEKALLSTYNNFISESSVTKMLITEPVKLFMNLESLEKIEISLPTPSKNYSFSASREQIEDFIKMDLAELKIDKNLWRDNFLGKYVYDNKQSTRFLETFVSIS
jgi:hypothetical protein